MSSSIDMMVGNRPLSSLRVVDLKQELEKRGLSKSGTKKDLAERLRLHLQIEKQRIEGATADEEELPNISVHGDLADQNPFIRDYLASQAELFHSQKVVKKLVEEEAKRESETSADESSDSPVKQRQPSASTVLREESPVFEPKRQSRRRTDSQKEEMTAEKLLTRSSRSRSPAAATAPPPIEETENKNNNVEVQIEQEKLPKLEPEKIVPVPPEEPPKEEPPKAASSPPRLTEIENSVKPPELPIEAEISSKPNENNEIPKVEEIKKVIVEEKAEENEINDKGIAKSISSSPVSAETKTIETKQVDENKESENTTAVEMKVVEENNKAADAITTEAKAVEENEEEEAIDKPVPEEAMEIDLKVTSKNGEHHEHRSRSSSPVEKMEVSNAESPVRPDKEVKSQDKADDSASSDNDDNSSSRSKSRSRSRSKSKSRSRSRSRSVDSRDEDSAVEKRSDGSKSENDEESKDVVDAEEASITEPQTRTRKSRSVSQSPGRDKSPVKQNEKKIEEHDKEVESEAKVELKTKPAEVGEKEVESSSARYKSSQKETYTKFDLAGEEALDYGEEEDDEDRNDSEAQEYAWTRRSLRFKTKPVFATPACKWKLEEESSKHLVIKSDLLNTYYQDIKLVPLELLKLEEKATGNSEVKADLERKPSISQESVGDEPLITRTVEIVPTVKRTVSIVPSSTRVQAEQPEDADKTLTPPRNPPTNILLITNLVRPFTLPQLKEMLQRTGNLQDIWVDKIKSKCIAKFDSQEEAFETRAALHGVCWPASNPKSLHVDYTTSDNLDDHKAKEGLEQNPLSEKPVTAQHVPVREWDVGKKTESKSPTRARKRSRSRSTSRDRLKRVRRSPSLGRRRHSRSPAHERRSRGGEGKEPEPMGKALDELFRKTVATPSIYWLPLTPEQIAEKEELRRKRMLERERRLAELSKMRPR